MRNPWTIAVAISAIVALAAIASWINEASDACAAEKKRSRQLRKQQRIEQRRNNIDERRKAKKLQHQAERQRVYKETKDVPQAEKQKNYEAKLALKQRKKEELEDKLNYAMATGLRVVVDLGFLQGQSLREQNSVIKQVGCAYGVMKRSEFPLLLSLHFASYHGDIAAICDKAGLNVWKATRHSEPIEELFPGESIVMLSPDSPNVLTEIDPKTIYVIGGIVDRTVRKSETLTKASRIRHIQTARFPSECSDNSLLEIKMSSPSKSTLLAHVRHVFGTNTITIKFPLLGTDRQLVRQVDEELSRILVRIDRLLHPPNSKQVQKQGKKTKMKQIHQQLGKSNTLIELRDGNGTLLETTLPLGKALTQATTLQIQQDIYKIVLNEPSIKSISLIDHILMTGVPLVPMVDMEFCTPSDCIWKWERLNDDGKANLVSTACMYTPKDDDIGKFLRITCTSPIDTIISMISKSKVEQGPDRSVFNSRHALIENTCLDDTSFRIMSYNILYSKYARADREYNRMYPFAKAGILHDRYRMPLIGLEMIESKCHLICTQEMGENIFHTYFNPLLSAHGFKGIYSNKAGSTPEGCAFFIHESKWDIIESMNITFSKALNDIEKEDIKSPLQMFLAAHTQVALAVRTVPSVAQIVLLQSKAHPNQAILVANTHLYYRHDADAVRLVQSALMTRFLEEKKAHFSASLGLNIGVIIAGDLNSLPDACPAQYLLHGSINENHRHWKEASSFEWSSNTSLSCPMTWDSNIEKVLTHQLALTSACGTPEFTHLVKNHEFTFIGTLDHILIDSTTLTCTQSFPFFTLEQATHETSLPTSVFPSDHISLLADIRLTSNTSTTTHITP
ncbi:2',5'-phosphodiesterase [Thraustotheca clavata]|uniref:2',5'-phosphodiesterase n=1 Tax=Thraustotheca clavata TaxID=74557 RepID=A0A1V9ZSR7_9STRA|nr:2',5'-phosphodiesterase [Thraustotheca clavata]